MDIYTIQDSFLMKLSKAKKDIGISPMLCGGTAIAREYLQHRVSYDLDFFLPETFDPEVLASRLGRSGIVLNEIQTESGGKFVAQLFAIWDLDGLPLKVSFIEDHYADMFPQKAISFTETDIPTESLEGLFHRKLRTVTGMTQGDVPVGGRQTARDLFDLYCLDCSYMDIPGFIDYINKQGANFPAKAFSAGLGAMSWLNLMDEFSRIDYTPEAARKYNIPDKEQIMGAVRNRMQGVFKEVTSHGAHFKA